MINFVKKFIKTKEITRFPPEPNGFLHIGHTFSIFYNNIISYNTNGIFFLRFDNTNYKNINFIFFKCIKFDILWLGIKWHTKTKYFSNNINFYYKNLILLIKIKKIYYKKKIINIRFYNNYLFKKNIFELILFKNFFYNVLSFSLFFKKKIIFRIKNFKKNWCIFPTYDFSQSINDKLNLISLSLCTDEFIINAKIYNFFIKKYKNIIQIEFNKKKIKKVNLSKRYNKKKKKFNIFYLKNKGITPTSLFLLINFVSITKCVNYIKNFYIKKSIYFEINYLYKKNKKYINFVIIKNYFKNIIFSNYYNIKNLNLNYFNILFKKNFYYYIKNFILFKNILLYKKYYFYKKNKNNFIIIKILNNVN